MDTFPQWRRITLSTGVDSSTSTPSGPNLYHSIQPLLDELECQNPSSLQDKGMLSWTLHKNVEKDPSKANVLVEELVNGLEKALRADKKGCIIPLLLTLIHVVFQSVHIPKDLYERAYAICKSVLKLQKPYCDVGLACVRHMQTERSKPGALYQRTVIAEQNLWSESFPFQEMVFVFADAAVFSGPLGEAVKEYLEVVGSPRPPVSHMRAVLQHTLQAALGNDCDSKALAHALKGMGRMVLPNFQEVVQTVEQNEWDRDKANKYRDRLQRLYTHILSQADEGEPSGDSVHDTPLPPLEVRYHLWQDEAELWLQLEKCIPRRLAVAVPDMQRASQISTDSGIERDLPEHEPSEAPAGRPRWSEHKWVRKVGVKKRNFRSSSLPTISSVDLGDDMNGDGGTNPCYFTPFLMVMGDDRVLGKLAKAYHTLRTGGTSLSLMSRLNLEIYYIPVTDQHTAMDGSLPEQSYLDFASYLGRVDPWYECNINSLAHWIPTLAMPSRSSDPNPFLLDVLSYYKRTAWQRVHFTIYSIKITFFDPKKSLEQVFLTRLEVDFTERANINESVKKETTPKICGPVVSITYRKMTLSNRQVEKGIAGRLTGIVISTIPSNKKEVPDHDQLTLRFKDPQAKEPLIRIRNIEIKSVENKNFTICLDQDTRRTYEHVQRIEISPCLDPRGLQTKDLCLPINTFSGIIH